MAPSPSARPTSLGTLVLMGSGETTPTMVTTHKAILDTTRERTGAAVDAVLLNTPYGFQENAEEITAKAQRYFDHNVGQPVRPLDAADVLSAGPSDVERSLDRLRRADWVFAGPGSPTHALRHWTAAPFTEAMADVHRRGGTLVFASAAAVTVGSHALPVYEVYKAGEPPAWRAGLGLVEQLTGWSCVVIPHFDNAEGGTHDTRFCYMGERRLAALERDLPPEAWILGIDEHTACIIDGSAGTVTVQGRGAVHVRRQGRNVFHVAGGEQVPLTAIADAGTGTVGPDAAATEGDAVRSPTTAPPSDPFADQLAVLRARFDSALADRQAGAATTAALSVEQLIRDWAADTLSSDALDRATAVLRGMITRLGVLAGEGMHDHTELVRPLVETLLHVRDDARQRKVYEVADHIRGHMDRDGVRVRDTEEGTLWEWDEPS